MKPFVLILGVPRSGTSLVAGIFARHGFWTGTCRQPDAFNERGHFENLAVKNLMKRWWHGNGHTNDGVEARPKFGFRDEAERLLERDGWRGQPWLFKCAPVYWRLFSEWSPLYVTVRRDPGAIIESNRATNFIPQIEKVLPAHLALLDKVETRKKAAVVDADRLVRGDFTSVVAALDVAGAEPNEGLIEGFVDPRLWRHAA